MALTKVSSAMIDGNTVNVLSLGADNTGSSDATSIIQSAINSGASVVYFPAGTYKVTSTITMVANQKLMGDGIGNTVIQLSGNFGATTGFEATDIGGSEIEHIHFQGSSHSSTEPVISYDHSGTANLQGPQVRNCKFSDFDANGCFLVTGTFDNADWLLYGEPDASTWNVYENTKITDCIFQDNTVPDSLFGTGQVAVTATRNTTISGISTLNCQERSISCGYNTDILVSKCVLNTTGNNNANSNPHGVYMRTVKRFSIDCCDININTTNNMWAIRLSRGAYYGTISNCTGVGLLGSGGAGGFGSIGGNDIVVSGCYFKTPVNACVISGHSSGSGTDGASDSSFAPANNILITGSYFETATDSPALYANSVAVTSSDSAESEFGMNNVKIDGCVFVNNVDEAEKIAFLTLGTDCIVSNSKFYGENPWAGVLLERDTRTPNDQFNWYFFQCEFYSETETTSSDASSPYGAEFTTVGIISEGSLSGQEGEAAVSDCFFKNWYTGIGINNGYPMNIEGCQFRDNFHGIRTDGSQSTQPFISQNVFKNPNSGGSCIMLSVSNSTTTTYNYIANNQFRGVAASGIRFDGTAQTAPGMKLLYIAGNQYEGTAEFIKDCADIATIKITHNLVTETVASNLPANPIDQFNYGIT
jgi:hypothetical protein